MIPMTATTPDDLLAAIPVVLGFHPHDSVVMLTFGGKRVFHARLDMLTPQQARDQLDDFARVLLGPAIRQHTAAVVFVYYCPDAALVALVHRGLSARFRADDVRVLDGMRVEGDRWFPAWKVPSSGDSGKPFDAVNHPFAAQAVMAGLVTAGSREELARRLDSSPAAAVSVGEVMAEATRLRGDQARDLIEAHVGAGTFLSDAEAAAMLVSIADAQVREAAWWGVTRQQADRHAEFWTDLVRRSPPASVGEACAILAAVSWVAGHGALAWCAIDRARADGGNNELLGLIDGLLTAGVPPTGGWPATRPGRTAS